jgi:hypothetical protein
VGTKPHPQCAACAFDEDLSKHGAHPTRHSEPEMGWAAKPEPIFVSFSRFKPPVLCLALEDSNPKERI